MKIHVFPLYYVAHGLLINFTPPINSNLYHYAGNNPVKYVDPKNIYDFGEFYFFGDFSFSNNISPFP